MVITSSVYMNGMARQLEGSSVGKFAGWGEQHLKGALWRGVICWTPFDGLGISTSDRILSCVLLTKYVRSLLCRHKSVWCQWFSHCVTQRWHCCHPQAQHFVGEVEENLAQCQQQMYTWPMLYLHAIFCLRCVLSCWNILPILNTASPHCYQLSALSSCSLNMTMVFTISRGM